MGVELAHRNKEIEKDAIAWRYMGFENMYTLFASNEIIFTRLDVFDDPLEGLPLKTKLDINYKRSNMLIAPEFFGRISSDEENKKADEIIITPNDLLRYKMGTYSSCWYLTENIDNGEPIRPFDHHESMAMWNLYSSSKGFVVRMKFDILKQAIEEALKNFSDEEIDNAIFGKIKYQSIGDEIHDQPANNEPSLIKDRSLAYENEVRFILKRKEGDYYIDERKLIKLKLPIKLNEIKDNHSAMCNCPSKR